MPRIAAIATALFFALSPVAGGPAAAKDPIYTGFFSSLAVDGYDPVAYFTEEKPVRGSSRHELKYKGATWRFSSAANLARFRAEPEKYAPQYGGYCAWAVSQGYTASGDPKIWRVVNGRLFLNYNRKVQEKWEKDIPGLVHKADRNWPAVLKD